MAFSPLNLIIYVFHRKEVQQSIALLLLRIVRDVMRVKQLIILRERLLLQPLRLGRDRRTEVGTAIYLLYIASRPAPRPRKPMIRKRSEPIVTKR